MSVHRITTKYYSQANLAVDVILLHRSVTTIVLIAMFLYKKIQLCI